MSAESILDAIAPQFKNNADKSTFLTIATSLTSQCYFGAQYDYAVALRAAHMLTLTNRPGGSSGVSGSVTSLKEGDSAIGFGSAGNTAGSGDLTTTSYGQQLKSLINNGGGQFSVTRNSATAYNTSCGG